MRTPANEVRSRSSIQKQSAFAVLEEQCEALRNNGLVLYQAPQGQDRKACACGVLAPTTGA